MIVVYRVTAWQWVYTAVSIIYDSVSNSDCVIFLNLLFNDAISDRLCGVVDRMINEYGMVGGMRIGRGTEVLRENMFQCHFAHH
jgi:hypothetical protein